MEKQEQNEEVTGILAKQRVGKFLVFLCQNDVMHCNVTLFHPISFEDCQHMAGGSPNGKSCDIRVMRQGKGELTAQLC